MATIASGYEKYKIYQYNAVTDTHQLISPWANADTVERPNGTIVQDELSRLYSKIDGMIDDTDIDTDTTWSSSKIKSRVDAEPQIDDANISATSLWSSEKVAKYRQQTKTIAPGKTENLEMFEGFFAIVRAGATSEGVVGVVDRWGDITYLQNNCWGEKIDKDGNKYMGGLATIVKNGNVMSVTNCKNTAHIIVYYFTTWAFTGEGGVM